MKIFLLLLFCRSLFAVKHSLKYFITGSSGVPNIPELMGVMVVDGIQAGYCNSSHKILEPRQDWAERILANDTQQLQWYKQKCFEDQPNVFRNLISSLRQQFNQSEGVHILQRIDGCEWDENTGEVTGMLQYGYNGEGFLEFDQKTLTWITLKPEANVTKQKWDADKAAIKHKENDLINICPSYLKMYLIHIKSILQRTALPSVSLLQKSPSSPISCHATGFYPHRAVMFWRKDGEEIHEGVDPGEILPNDGETFQMSVDLNVSSVTPADRSRYECVFQLSGVEDAIITRLNETEIRTNWGQTKKKMPSDTTISITVVVVLILIAAVAFVVYKNKKAVSGCWNRFWLSWSERQTGHQSVTGLTQRDTSRAHRSSVI